MVSSGPYADLVGSVRDRLPAVLHYHISHEALNGTRLENYTIHRLTRHVDSARLRADKTEGRRIQYIAALRNSYGSCQPHGRLGKLQPYGSYLDS